MIHFWVCLISGNIKRISSVVFVFPKNLYDNNISQSTWVSKVKLSTNRRLDPELLKLLIECKLTDMDLQRWHEKLHRNPSSDGYKLFKVDFTLRCI